MDTLAPGFLLIVFGVLTMLGSALNWRFVTRSGKLFNMVFGDTVARIIYFGVGIFLFVKGIEFLIGANWF
ncbi:MAG: hypothetical protein JNM02_10510 [Anaerolineales bacterium]|nr:hypothetical protein [Anaerolineales bacterium]